MASSEDIDEFVTCGVCFLEYDEEIRKPKFLPCSHTVCLLCLKVYIKNWDRTFGKPLLYWHLLGNSSWYHHKVHYVPLLSSFGFYRYHKAKKMGAAQQYLCASNAQIKRTNNCVKFICCCLSSVCSQNIYNMNILFVVNHILLFTGWRTLIWTPFWNQRKNSWK